MAIALLVLAASPLWAQSVEVSTSLDLTDGFAREGAYLPVRLRISNRSQVQITDVHLVTGGPVDAWAPLELAPGANEEAVLPVLFLGGTPTLTLEFLSGGKPVDRVSVGPLAVRKLADDEALVAIGKDQPVPEGEAKESLARLLDVKEVRTVSLSPEALALVQQFGAVDARIGAAAAGVPGRGVIVSTGPKGELSLASPRLPLGTEVPVQPETYRLLASEVWPTEERGRLWLWLGLVCVAVPAVGLWIARRRAVAATLSLVALAAGATVLVAYLGELSRTRLTEATVLYARAGEKTAAMERFVLVESRGSAPARLAWPAASPLPTPVLGSSSDVFRPVGTLRLASAPSFESRRQQVLVHFLGAAQVPLDVRPGVDAAGEPKALADTRGIVAALRVKGDLAADGSGRSAPVTAWVAQWRASPQAELSYAGRSLAWWIAQRQEGEGEGVLAWTRSAGLAPAISGKSEIMPTLIVYQFPAVLPPGQ